MGDGSGNNSESGGRLVGTDSASGAQKEGVGRLGVGQETRDENRLRQESQVTTGLTLNGSASNVAVAGPVSGEIRGINGVASNSSGSGASVPAPSTTFVTAPAAPRAQNNNAASRLAPTWKVNNDGMIEFDDSDDEEVVQPPPPPPARARGRSAQLIYQLASSDEEDGAANAGHASNGGGARAGACPAARPTPTVGSISGEPIDVDDVAIPIALPLMSTCSDVLSTPVATASGSNAARAPADEEDDNDDCVILSSPVPALKRKAETVDLTGPDDPIDVDNFVLTPHEQLRLQGLKRPKRDVPVPTPESAPAAASIATEPPAVPDWVNAFNNSPVKNPPLSFPNWPAALKMVLDTARAFAPTSQPSDEVRALLGDDWRPPRPKLEALPTDMINLSFELLDPLLSIPPGALKAPQKSYDHLALLYHSAAMIHSVYTDLELAAVVADYPGYQDQHQELQKKHPLWMFEACNILSSFSREGKGKGAAESVELKYQRGQNAVKIMRGFFVHPRDLSRKDLLRPLPRGIDRLHRSTAPRSMKGVLGYMTGRQIGFHRKAPSQVRHAYRFCETIGMGTGDVTELIFIEDAQKRHLSLFAGFMAEKLLQSTETLLCSRISQEPYEGRLKVSAKWPVIHHSLDANGSLAGATVMDVKRVRGPFKDGEPDFVVTCGHDGTVAVIPVDDPDDADRLTISKRKKDGEDVMACRVAVRPHRSAEGDTFAAGFSDGRVIFFSPGKGTTDKKGYHKSLSKQVKDVSWNFPSAIVDRRDHNEVAEMIWLEPYVIIGYDICRWDAAKEKSRNSGVIAFAPLHGNKAPEPIVLPYPVACMALSSSGNYLAVGVTVNEMDNGSDTLVRIFEVQFRTAQRDDVAGLKLVDNVKTNTEDLNELSWSPDDRFLVTLGSDGYVNIWDMLPLVRPKREDDVPQAGSSTDNSRENTKRATRSSNAQNPTLKPSKASSLGINKFKRWASVNHSEYAEEVKGVEEDGVRAHAWLADGTLVIGGGDGRIAFYELSSPGSYELEDDQKRTLKPARIIVCDSALGAITRLTVSKDGMYLAVGLKNRVSVYALSMGDVAMVPPPLHLAAEEDYAQVAEAEARYARRAEATEAARAEHALRSNAEGPSDRPMEEPAEGVPELESQSGSASNEEMEMEVDGFGVAAGFEEDDDDEEEDESPDLLVSYGMEDDDDMGPVSSPVFRPQRQLFGRA